MHILTTQQEVKTMATYQCSWRMYGAQEWVTYRINARTEQQAFNTLVVKARENHMIQIGKVERVKP